MKTRGSLRAMIMLMPQMFKMTGAERLAIYQVSRGKYYNLVNEEQLHDLIQHGALEPGISFLSLTLQELQSIFRIDQLNLFPKDNHDTDTHNH